LFAKKWISFGKKISVEMNYFPMFICIIENKFENNTF